MATRSLVILILSICFHEICATRDVPNPCEINQIQCNMRDARISWIPRGDNLSPILHYTIQYNTSFAPDKWEVIADLIPASDFSYIVPLTPWANYTFRVIAVNEIGPSIASQHSEVCTTSPDVPYNHPDNVKVQVDKLYNLIISWTPMPQFEHNGPNFLYRVYWKIDTPETEYQVIDVFNWMQNVIIIDDVPTSTRFRIKVIALNELGEANAVVKEVTANSGETSAN